MPYLSPPGTTISGLTTGQYVVAASSSSLATDGVKRYVALLTQSGTGDPTALVQINTLGETPTFGRGDVGSYALNVIASIFTTNKTTVLLSGPGQTDGAAFKWVSTQGTDVSQIPIKSGTVDADGHAVFADDILQGITIEVCVYL